MSDNIDNNETNPLLRFDAFMGNVKDGGLRSVTSIYILVSYLVSNLNGKVSRETLLEATNSYVIEDMQEKTECRQENKAENMSFNPFTASPAANPA